MRTKLSQLILGLTGFVFILLAWSALCAAHRVPAYILPSPATVLARAWQENADGHDLLATLQRVLCGFAVGTTSGLALGLALGNFRIVERLIGPLFMAYRQVAPFAWIPLLSLWFGGGEAGKIAFVTLTSFAPSVVNSWRAARAIPSSYRELAAALMLSRFEALRLIGLPGALPGILTGVRLSLIYAWVATVGAEIFLDIASGLGGRLNEARDKFEIDLMLATLLVLAATGLVFSRLAAFGERQLLRARGS